MIGKYLIYMLRIKNDIIGRGTFGKVYGSADGRYAIKKIFLPNEPTDLHWVTEITLLGHLKHPKMPQLVNVTLDGKHCRIVMKRYKQLEGFDVSTISDDLRWTILTDIGEVLAYLHHFGLIHTDIKRRNVLLAIEGSEVQKAILCDYGLVKATSYGRLKRGTDTSIYSSGISDTNSFCPDTSVYDTYKAYKAYPICSRPPEIVTDAHISKRSDIWGFGCLAMALCSHVEGIDISKIQKMSQKAIDDIVVSHTKPGLMREVCLSSLRVEPDERSSLENMLGLMTKYSNKSTSLLTDTAHQMYNIFCRKPDRCVHTKPYEVLTDFICATTTNKDLHKNVRKMVMTWNTKSEISEDAVLMCIHLISRYASLITPGALDKDVYVQVMVCVNMAMQLFHPDIRIKLDDIYFDMPHGNYVQEVCTMMELFKYDILADM